MSIPADDPMRTLTVADPDAPNLRRVSVAGDTYTILVRGADTAGRYCLIDMHVPPGGGPPPHRHDFEEMFSLLEGELDFTFRGRTTTIRAGSTVNIPANAPHSFVNASGAAARTLCMATPAGLDDYFLEIGDPVDSRTARAAGTDPRADRRAAGKGGLAAGEVPHRNRARLTSRPRTAARRRGA